MIDQRKRYIMTDMAVERLPAAPSEHIETTERSQKGYHVHSLRVKAERPGLPPMGRYITVTLGKPWLGADEAREQAVSLISELLWELCEPYIKRPNSVVLTACLGNRRITTDALGPICADNLIVTRHLKTERPDIYRSFNGTELSAVIPGVVGDTGIETCELIRSAVNIARPDIVIAVDALAARSTDRLAVTVQLSDAGISPGSGIGNRRKAIDRRTLGVPVISIGVPTVVLSSTMVYDTLEKAGAQTDETKLRPILENDLNFFVAPKDADISVTEQAKIVAQAINLAFLSIPHL